MTGESGRWYYAQARSRASRSVTAKDRSAVTAGTFADLTTL
jgi:hypothetical protein